MGKENSHMLMEMNMKGIGNKIRLMDSESILTVMEQDMKDIG